LIEWVALRLKRFGIWASIFILSYTVEKLALMEQPKILLDASVVQKEAVYHSSLMVSL
jgi:hypothetical protein